MTDNRGSGWKLRFAPHLGFLSPDQPMFAASAGSPDPVAQIEFIAGQGFAGIEDNCLKQRSIRDQERMGAALARCNLEMGCFVNTAESSQQPLLASDDPAVRPVLARELRESIEAAQRVNGRYLTTFGSRDLQRPLDQQLSALVENLKPLAEIAEKAGVVLCLEQTAEARYPGMLLHRFEDCCRAVEAVNSPALRVLFDVLAVQVAEGGVIEYLRRSWDLIAVIQVSDDPGRVEPGAGELDYVEIFRFLLERDYRGLVELECFLSQPGLAGEQGVLRRLREIDRCL